MKVALSFITYNQSSFKYLEFFLPSLAGSIETAAKIWGEKLELSVFVLDNSDTSYRDNYDFLVNFFNDKKINNKIWVSDYNSGFAKGYNLMLNFALANNFDKFIMVNPDVLLDENFIEKLLNKSEQAPEFAVLAPTILYFDYLNNKKTNIIDSCGLGIKKNHYFFDRGQGQIFQENLFKEEEIFGFTGAGALLDLKKVSTVAIKKDENYLEFFDELMFMYKEDVELSYRLQLAGLKTLFVPTAVMYHHRSLGSFRSAIKDLIFNAKNNFGRSYSFLNQLIILYKIRKLPFSAEIKLLTILRFFLIFVYGLFFQKKQLLKFLKIRRQIDIKPLYLKANVIGAERIKGFMSTY